MRPHALALLALTACGLNPAFKSTGSADADATSGELATSAASTSAPTTADVSTSSAVATSDGTTEPVDTTATGTTTAGPGSDGSSSDTGGSVDPACPFKDAALVACYTFDDDGGAVLLDGSGHGVDGTLKNVTYVPSYALEYGTAAQLAGDSAIDVPNLPLLNPERFTVAMLAYAVAGPGGDQFLVDKNFQLSLVQNGDGLKCRVITKDGGDVTAQTKVVLDAWNHVACTYDGETVTVSVHSAASDQYGTAQQAGVLAPAKPDPMAIGRDTPEDQKRMYGALDQFLFYDRALADTELCGLAGALC